MYYKRHGLIIAKTQYHQQIEAKKKNLPTPFLTITKLLRLEAQSYPPRKRAAKVKQILTKQDEKNIFLPPPQKKEGKTTQTSTIYSNKPENIRNENP